LILKAMSSYYVKAASSDQQDPIYVD